MPALIAQLSRPNKVARLRLIPINILVTALLLVQLAAGQAPAKPQAVALKDVWAESLIGGNQTGSYHEAAVLGQNQQILTSMETHLVFNRMGAKVEIQSSTHYEESADGGLLGIRSEMSSSAQSTKTDVTVKDGSLVIRTSTGGQAYDRTLPFTGALLGPEAARRLTVARLKLPGDTVSYQTFYPELGSIATITQTLVDRESLSIEGTPIATLKIEQTMSAMPGKIIMWLDSDGWIVRQLMPSPFGDIETLRTSAEKIQHTELKGATLPQEIFANTLVKSNVRLPEERLIEQLTIRITQRKPELGWPDLTADNQTVLEKAPDHVVLQIRRIAPKEDGHRPLETADPALLPFLQPNALLQSDDAAVRSIAARIVGNDADAYRAARSLQEWTNENMRFDLGIAIAPASEVARNRRGTCFGYAVLLASLARAEGIPSRFRMGFVYAGGIWGGHAWVEVLAGNTWVPLDGALYSPGPADAARFSFFTSALQEGTIAQVGELAKLYGNVDIQVLDYTLHGKRVVVPQDAKPFSISGDTYQNPSLGLTVQKPKSFRFTSVDAVWPASTVVAMEGPQQQLVEIQSRSESMPVRDAGAEEKALRDANITGTRSEREVAGRPAVLITSANTAGLAVKRGGDLFVITAKGSGAEQLLMQVASTLKLED